MRSPARMRRTGGLAVVTAFLSCGQEQTLGMNLQDYMSERVEPQIAFYGQAASRAKKNHLRLQSAIIVLGVLVPVLVNLPAWGPWVQGAVTAVSLLLPVLTGIANFRKHGELWLSYRTAVELLRNEKYLFLTRSGRYRDNPAGFFDFVEAVEAILAAEHSKFKTVFEQARRPVGDAPQAPGSGGGAANDKDTDWDGGEPPRSGPEVPVPV